ncbi:cystathionine gamma-synthase [Mycobacteroides abscessus subsp. abscessus]|nr:cystathionine gamma-synthase [Mycobacteroides abscessus subsp. abscessus]
MDMNWSMDTQVIHSNHQVFKKPKAISHSIVPAVAYAFPSVESAADVVSGNVEGFYYGRYGNPTLQVLETKIADLEKGEAALGVASGMAAISIALLAHLETGDHALVTKDVYGGTYHFLTSLAPRFGIEIDFMDCTDVEAILSAIKPNTKVIYIETPSNPTLTILDIPLIAEICQKNELVLIVDNTFMSPYLQNPLSLGADVVVHSATKYINGHGDVLAGFIVGNKADIQFMRKKIMGDLGQNLNAWEASLILRGLKTMVLRVQRHCENAQQVAKFLQDQPSISKVYYPGLPSHPQFELAQRQMRGMGGIVSFEVKGGLDAGKNLINSLKLAMISFSLGDPETLVQHPASMTHASIPREEREKYGITDGLIRLSVGLEAAKDIVADLSQAISSLEAEVKMRGGAE